ncbi:MAG: DNA repair protein RecN [Pseudomonadota bacterium]
MLTELHIQDFVLIGDVNLSFDIGLTALTGETGAGKSILLEALGLVAGARSTRGGIRRGASQGVVTAAFEPGPDHPVWTEMDANGFSTDECQIVLRRVQKADGRGRAFINGEPASIATLKSVGGALLEIHGQHDGRGFLNVSTHRALLDTYANLGDVLSMLRRLYADRLSVRNELDGRAEQLERDARESDYLQFVVDELSSLGVEEGEEATLAARRSELLATEKVADDLVAAQQALSDDSFESRLSQCTRRLSNAAKAFSTGVEPIEAAIERIDRVLSEAMEARALVEDITGRLAFDQNELNSVETRLFAIRAASRKHGVEADDLPRILKEAREGLERLSADNKESGVLRKKEKELDRQYKALAAEVRVAREAAARGLEAAVEKELAPLKLGHAKFLIDVAPKQVDEEGADGIDTVEFKVSTGPKSEPGPLKSVASGGELSRFVLALKAALAAKESRTVIIFDEVDAGVGGAVADAVGERLAKLASAAQVLVVTHSPQVASRGSAQMLVEKKISTDAASTTVRLLDPSERVEEIARMLSGATVTNEARAAAARLLAAPVKRPSKKAASKKRAPKSQQKRSVQRKSA